MSMTVAGRRFVFGIASSTSVAAFFAISGCLVLVVKFPVFGQMNATRVSPAERAAEIRRALAEKSHDEWEAVYHGIKQPFSEEEARLYLWKSLGFAIVQFKVSGIGTVQQSSGRLSLKSTQGDWGPGHATDTKEFVSLPWGPRLYLVEVNRVVEFCNAINAGVEPRSAAAGQFLLREGDWQKKATGFPSIPKPWQQKYILKEPIETEIQKLVGNFERVEIPEFPYGNGKLEGIRCAVRMGAKHGLRPGMTLYSTSKALHCSAYVLAINKDTAEIVVLNDDLTVSNAEFKRRLQEGTKLSTRQIQEGSE